MNRLIQFVMRRADVLRYGTFLLVAAVIPLLLWPNLLQNLFATGNGLKSFQPHPHCYLFIPQLIYLHLFSDILIGLSYVAISLTLTYLVYRARRDMPFHWVFLAFGLFIIACGGTHFMEVVTSYKATYWLSGYVKLVTAVASVATALVLPPLVPKTLALVQAAKLSEERRRQLEQINDEMEALRERERQQMQGALDASEQRLQAILENTTAAVYAKDAGGRYLLLNREMERILGAPKEQVLGRTDYDFFAPELAETLRANDLEVLAAAAPVELEEEVPRGGELRTYISAKFTLHDADGKPYAVCGISTDITERRRAEEALRDSEERYRRLVEVSPDAIFVNHGGKIVFINEAGLRLFGATHSAQIVGKSPFDLFHPDFHPAIVERMREMTERGLSAPTMEEKIVRLDGGEVPVEVTATPFADKGEASIQVVLRDITERKRVEQEREELLARERGARRMAEDANRAKDEFLATLSHELRTPLTPVIGWVHMMRSGMIPTAELDRGLAVIDKNSQALSRLINDLLDMSAILSGKMRIESQPVVVEAAVNEAVETVRPQAEARGTEIVLEPCAQKYLMVGGDRTRLVQIFWNLLNNAVKFSEGAGPVRVRCEAAGGEARVVVEDQGQGIAPEFLPFVFERFSQADSSKTRAHGGLGIGLALVKSFVEAHGGRVEAESRGAGHGSRFVVSLPLLSPTASDREQPEGATGTSAAREGVGAEANATATAEVAPNTPRVEETAAAPRAEPIVASSEVAAAVSAGNGGPRALLVEDAEDTLAMLRMSLERRGYRVTACETAGEALRAAPSVAEGFDIIISDIGLPDTSGYELIRQLRAVPRLARVPAIALTGYAAREDAEAAHAAGFDAHLAKPFDPAQLAALVEQLLRREAAG